MNQTLSRGCTDSTALNYNSNANQDDGTCEYEVTNPGDNQDNDANGDDTCVGICDEDTNDKAQSDDSDPVFVLTIVMVIIFIVAISIIFVFKDKDRERKSIMKKVMMEFVPELPPLEPPKD